MVIPPVLSAICSLIKMKAACTVVPSRCHVYNLCVVSLYCCCEAECPGVGILDLQLCLLKTWSSARSFYFPILQVKLKFTLGHRYCELLFLSARLEVHFRGRTATHDWCIRFNPQCYTTKRKWTIRAVNIVQWKVWLALDAQQTAAQ